MKSPRDHHQDDGFEEVEPFSNRNALVAFFLILILVLVGLRIWLTPTSQDPEVKEELVIPWSPHPPLERENEPLFEDPAGL